LSKDSGQQHPPYPRSAFTIPTVRGAGLTMEISQLCERCQLIDFDAIFAPGRSIPPTNGVFIVALEKLQYNAACPACCLFDSIALRSSSVREKTLKGYHSRSFRAAPYFGASEPTRYEQPAVELSVFPGILRKESLRWRVCYNCRRSWLRCGPRPSWYQPPKAQHTTLGHH
jgi:hypothetical protein